VDLRDGAAALGHELVLHLHRLEHDDRLTARDGVADRDEHLHDLAGDRRPQHLAACLVGARLGSRREPAMQRVLDGERHLTRADRRRDATAPRVEIDDVLLAAEDERPGARSERLAVDLVHGAVERDPELAVPEGFDHDRAISSVGGDDQLALHRKLLIHALPGGGDACYPRCDVPGLADVLLQRRIIVCVGSGGVGKTTTAATLALAAARRGKRTLVLTIDPAKRLANSLGLSELGHTVQEVDRKLVRTGAPSDKGELHAMMLDQKAAFDEVVQRHAKDPAAVQRILANPVYAQISGSLAGSQEYAAMAKLHDFDHSGNWDTIVVDTPPTAHALDFLDAPRKLSEAIDSPAIEWFRKLQGGSGSGWSLVGKTGAFVLKRLAKFVGSQFINDLGVFFTEFNDILGGFKTRAEETFALLRQDRVGFLLVASPEPMAMREALYFHERLVAAKMPFIGFVVNKVHPTLPIRADAPAIAAALEKHPAVAGLGLSGTTRSMAAQSLFTAHGDIETLAEADRAAITQLRGAGGKQSLLIEVPLLRDDVHDVERLVGLERYLLA
jgi:anion-transporting  ArsA/GET3 family ATPase